MKYYVATFNSSDHPPNRGHALPPLPKGRGLPRGPDEWNEFNSWGQHDANRLGFYDYFREVCGLTKQTEKLIPLTELAKETGWHLFYKHVAILSERPTEMHRNARGRLHNFSRPAIKWADGYELYRFNGVIVSKEHAGREIKDFTKEIILNEQNADVRREIIRKIGIEETVKILGAKIIDQMDDYELLSVDFGDKQGRPYLKMKNPSINVVHIEGVAHGIKTVKEALKWRNGLEEYTAPMAIV